MSWRDDPVHAGRLCGEPYGDWLYRRAEGWVYCRTHNVDMLRDDIAACGPVRLVTGGSDAEATDEMARRLPGNVSAWWSTNASGRRVRPLPLGLVWSAERMEWMAEAADAPREADRLLYVCHTVYGPGTERAELYERFSGESWVTAEGGGGPGDVPGRDYYLALRRHAFVLAPEGAGPDTHRLWEALAMGCTPVVKWHPCQRAWEHLPVMWVDGWEQVTMERLASAAVEMDGLWQDGEPRELSWDYWRGRILAE